MNAVYHVDAEDLDENFLQGLKQTFQRRLEIIVREEDETEYLLSSANRRQLVAALQDVQAGRNVVVPDQTAFES
jgi:hypothetical protein